jgi:hypothetical protein
MIVPLKPYSGFAPRRSAREGIKVSLNILFGRLPLLGSFPDIQSGSRSERRSRSSPLQFVARDSKGTFLIGSDPVRERTALTVCGNGLICLTHRVRTQVGNVSLHDRLVLFWSSCLAIVGCEFRKIRPGDDERHAAVRVERHLALRIGTKQIALLAVLLKRDRNERPRSYEVFGRRLRGYSPESVRRPRNRRQREFALCEIPF